MAAYDLNYISSRDKQNFEERVHLSHILDKHLSCKEYDDACILPYNGLFEGGVVDSKGVFIKNTTVHEELQEHLYKFSEECVTFDDREVLFIGDLYSVYGHAITDNLKKIWYFQTEECKKLLANGVVLVCITFHGQKLDDYVFQLLELAGLVNVDQVEVVDRITRFKKVYVPDNSMVLENGIRCYTSEFKSTIKLIKDSVDKENFSCYDKIYLSRTAIRQNRDFGEQEVESLFKKQGFEILHPEKLSIKEQISIFSHCCCMAATVGSVSHSAIFCRDGIELIVLQKSNYINGYQLMIEHMVDAKVTYIDINHSLPLKFPWGGPFFLSQTKYLSRYFSIFHIDFYFLKVSWLKYIIRYFHLLFSFWISKING